MKLTDLNPRWIGLKYWHGPAFYIGITFDCPHCHTQRLAAHFDKPIDPTNCFPDYRGFPDELKWKREGNTFETLSLSPSVDTSFEKHWHGFIQNGEIK